MTAETGKFEPSEDPFMGLKNLQLRFELWYLRLLSKIALDFS